MIFAYKSQAIVQHIDRVGELQPFWDCPSPPPFELQSRYNLNINKGPPLFMRYVEIYEDIAGITVACKNGLVHMLSHRRQSPQPLSVYARTESTGDGLVWVYFPMGRGESISAVWICEIAGDSYVRSPTIIVSTDLFLDIWILLIMRLVENLTWKTRTLWSLCPETRAPTFYLSPT
jgi:hypothetical protein